MANESRCIVCGRPLRSHSAIVRGMGSECAKKYAQMQASGGASSYSLQEGDIPVDYSHLNTDQHQIQQVVFNATDKKMKVQFTEDDYPCDLDLENDQQEVVYTFEPKDIEPSRFTESSYEGTSLKESYPFVSPITEDFKVETRTEGMSESEWTQLKGLVKHETVDKFMDEMLEKDQEDEIDVLMEKLEGRYEEYKTKYPWLPNRMDEKYEQMMYSELREDLLSNQSNRLQQFKNQLEQKKDKLEKQYEAEKQERLSAFGTQSFMDAPRVIDTENMKIPANAPREQYEKIVGAMLRPFGNKVSLKGLPPKNAHRVANVMYQLSQRYQPAFQYCSKFGTFDSFGDLMRGEYADESVDEAVRGLWRDEDEMGGFYHNNDADDSIPISKRVADTGIFLNQKAVRRSSTVNSYESFIRTEKFNVQYADYVVVHETGHLIHDTCDQETKKAIRELFERKHNMVSYHISVYGASNDGEMVAEAFADYSLNEHPSPLSQEVMGLVENSWQKQFNTRQVSPLVANYICQTAVESNEDYREVNELLNRIEEAGV